MDFSRFREKQLLDGHKPCNTTKIKVDRSYKHFIPQFAELQYCNDGQNKHYDVNAKRAADTYSKFLL